MHSESDYICDVCGEEIVIPIDVTQGRAQDFVEDCPVCCHPNRIRLEVDPYGDVRAWAQQE